MSYPQQQMQQQPVIIQDEQTTGTEAQKQAFLVAEHIFDMLKTSFGSMGMDKMLVDSLGDAIVTNDGATILKNTDIPHPMGGIIIEASATTDSQVGDGTTSTALLTCAIMGEAKKLVRKGIHPNIITRTLKRISDKATSVISENSEPVDLSDSIVISKLVRTALASKIVSDESVRLQSIVIDAVKAASNDSNVRTDLSAIKIEKKAGGSISDTEIINGIIIDKIPAHENMPKTLKDSKIALINEVLEVKKPGTDTQIQLSPNDLDKYVNVENDRLKEIANKIISTGAKVVVCSRGIDDIVLHFFQKAGIIALKRVKEGDIVNLQKSTGATILNSIENISESDLGFVGTFNVKILDDGSKYSYFEECPNKNSVTILLRGGNQKIIDEMERSLHDAIMIVKDVYEHPYMVVGAGNIEIILARNIIGWGLSTLEGKDRLVAKAFSEAVLKLPLTLAENAGMDIIDTEIELESRISNNRTELVGIDVIKGEVGEIKGIYEPSVVKKQVVTGAIESCCTILRIDNMLKSTKVPTPQ